MPDRPRPDSLDVYRRKAVLTRNELWLRYFELGGMCTPFQLEAFLYGALEPSPHDHEVIAHALNERYVELGGDRRVPYIGVRNEKPSTGGTASESV
jgi:hypothetical protein